MDDAELHFGMGEYGVYRLREALQAAYRGDEDVLDTAKLSGFVRTGTIEDEGQHLQSAIPSDMAQHNFHY